MGRFQITNVTRLECTKFSIQIIFPTTILGRYVAVNNHVCDTYEQFVGFRVYLKFSVEFAVVSITIIYCFEILHLIGCSHTHIGRDVMSNRFRRSVRFIGTDKKISRLARSAAIESNVSLPWTQLAPINLYPYPIENSIRFLMYRLFFILNCLIGLGEVIDNV